MGKQEKGLKAPSPEKINEVLGKAFWQIVEKYQLTQVESAILLGIKESNRQRLNSLKRKQAIPDDPDKALRVSHLVGIHKNLRVLFPHNREVVYSWLKTKRDLLNGQSAMEYIAQEPLQSLPRIFSIRRLLDQIRVSS